ncbi:helix-turn-helix transcriptional regulator [Priestia aryabhattai]|uniref:helix-turn-helix domain-containing protein n=1 Tax=Priestia aryabhattai TaxID=412384 RepID=UPI003D2D1747
MMSLYSGKPYRTKLGKFLDSKGISATWLSKKAGVNRNTINKLLNKQEEYSPNLSTVKKVMKVINMEIDKKKKSQDFFDI